ncbi:MAG TPA: hypothetical protein VK976_17420 [Verrucomicrobiae bacterium]|jgi:hypothetical protein|nr:hypothetical protein [Verrucomicrobiae bacterium]
MKLAAAMLLGLGIGCCPAAAQQALMASSPMPKLTLPASLSPAPPTPVTEIRVPELHVELATAVGIGLPNTGLYASVLPSSTVCTATLFRVLPDESSSYAFSKAQFSAASLKASFQHDNLVKMAHNFMPGQPLPDAPSYVPLTTQQKFDLYVNSTHNRDMGYSILGDALTAEVTGAYPTFGGGMKGFGQRVGVSAAGEEAAAFFSGFVFPTVFHQDPRYFRSHQTRIIDRLAYAASRVIIGRSDDGHTVFNFSAVSGQFVQAAISNAYIPYRNESVSGTIENALAGLSGVAQAQMLNEFWPDIKTFVTRHTPGLKDKAQSTNDTFTFR